MTEDDLRPDTSGHRALVLYTLLRMIVFVGTAGFFLLLGFNGFPLLLLALLVSSILSLVVLKPQRTALVAATEARRERRAAEKEQLRSRLDEA